MENKYITKFDEWNEDKKMTHSIVENNVFVNMRTGVSGIKTKT